MRLALSCFVASSSLLFAAAAPAAESGEKPNVIVIFIDDLGYGDIGPFGNKQVKTPQLDRMAAEGMKFTSFYATPVCSMSRACLMSGCYNARVSIPGVLFPNSRIGLHPDELTVAEVAKSRGYATACIGKWHLGHCEPFLPTKQGFDSYFGIPYSNDMTIDPQHAKLAKDCVFRDGMTAEKALSGTIKNEVPLMRDLEVVEYPADQTTLTRRYTEAAEAFIRTNRERPFFLYLPHTMVHYPLAVSAEFKDRSGHGILTDAIEELDWSVGRILQTLDELKLDDKTLVIFTSDNGAAAGSSAPWRGKKASTYEGGVREPCIMRWPGRIPAGTECDRIAGNIDLLPTVASLVGADLPTDRVFDGRDISSLLFNPKAPAVRDVHLYFARSDALVAVRRGDWKLFLDPPQPNQGKQPNKKPAETKPAAMVLYDLARDPAETTDVAAANPQIVAELRAEAERRAAEIAKNRRPPGRVDEAK